VHGSDLPSARISILFSSPTASVFSFHHLHNIWRKAPIIKFLVIEYIPYNCKETSPTPWSWALLERPSVVRPLDSFPAFHGTRRFNTAFTRALHLFLSWARPIQSTSPYPTSPRAILILSAHLRLGLPATKQKTNSMAWVRKRTIPTERPPLVGEVSANFCG
jgi:hypothetical protein